MAKAEMQLLFQAGAEVFRRGNAQHYRSVKKSCPENKSKTLIAIANFELQEIGMRA